MPLVESRLSNVAMSHPSERLAVGTSLPPRLCGLGPLGAALSCGIVRFAHRFVFRPYCIDQLRFRTCGRVSIGYSPCAHSSVAAVWVLLLCSLKCVRALRIFRSRHSTARGGLASDVRKACPQTALRFGCPVSSRPLRPRPRLRWRSGSRHASFSWLVTIRN